MPAAERLPAPDGGVTDALREGELKVDGRLTDASNATLYCVAVLGEGDEKSTVTCVYKPIAGENPLWDFPDGTLAAREVAAYEVSAALGWGLVPDTVMRDGPYGPGMCQRWVDTDDEARLLAVLPARARDGDLDGWCPIITVQLDDDEQGILAHRDSEALRRVALFDAIINNADRKGGHLLPGTDGQVYAIDHGVSFHVEDKLRTLLWGFAGRPLGESEAADLKRVHTDHALAGRITALLSDQETAAFRERVAALLAAGRFPGPEGRRRPIPWPLV
ncbi:SCO1664 family protein [Actinocrinis puniceicyclus]|uniref:SCO1664 family protein n=1 Tax=Actinocrinis puniceicyclus TaxID=977794 RepID=A0A8J8B998_9ACTN|nr:SCO1664 family protein [Actinocrinis puniceicyclus]MBS2961612.1 SCO1664 family protein [Actinocrinis puniceicyclus]